jgi:hypothetical protein
MAVGIERHLFEARFLISGLVPAAEMGARSGGFGAVQKVVRQDL